jgi:putative oxidoreductase
MGSYGATLLRLVLGIIYLMHGYYALTVLGPSGAAAYVQRLGLPLPVIGGWYLIIAHLAGGVLLIIGLWTRWAALAQIPIMVVALLLIHLKQGFFMKGQGMTGAAAGYEFALLVFVATIAQVILGGGALAVTKDRA